MCTEALVFMCPGSLLPHRPPALSIFPVLAPSGKATLRPSEPPEQPAPAPRPGWGPPSEEGVL